VNAFHEDLGRASLSGMLTLYHCPETRSMRSLWLLHEIGVPFQLIEMPFDLKWTRSAEYLAIHPLGRVPCLVDGELKLFESGAITQYLCEQVPESGMGRAVGHADRYAWLQWIHYSETIAVHGAALVQQLHFIAPAERSAAIGKLEGRRLEKAIQVVETELRDREYLLASGFSAADISVGYSLHLSARLTDLHQFPRVEAYYGKLSARPAFRASLPAGWTRPLSWLPDRREA
jgi:glutathione S-transferase